MSPPSARPLPLPHTHTHSTGPLFVVRYLCGIIGSTHNATVRPLRRQLMLRKAEEERRLNARSKEELDQLRLHLLVHLKQRWEQP